jgi:hypothetical protein
MKIKYFNLYLISTEQQHFDCLLQEDKMMRLQFRHVSLSFIVQIEKIEHNLRLRLQQ